MQEYRYLATKITKNENGEEIIDEDFETIEYLTLTGDKELVRTVGNNRLLSENPGLSLSDFCISVSTK